MSKQFKRQGCYGKHWEGEGGSSSTEEETSEDRKFSTVPNVRGKLLVTVHFVPHKNNF